MYGSVTGRNLFRFFLIVWGKFVFEEVVIQGKSITVPVKWVEGSRSAFLDLGISRCVGASFRWWRILSVIVFVFSEIIPQGRVAIGGALAPDPPRAHWSG